MRVESCGPLFEEPKEGDIFFQPHRLSEPIAIINPKNSYEDGDRFTRHVLQTETAHKRSFSFENEGRPHPVGFFLSEEEWSLIKQPRLGVDGNDSNDPVKMNSLPASLTPLASTSGDFDTYFDIRKGKDPTRKCGSPSTTPSLEFLNENEVNNNNNDIAENIPPVCQKLDEDDNENWTQANSSSDTIKEGDTTNLASSGVPQEMFHQNTFVEDIATATSNSTFTTTSVHDEVSLVAAIVAGRIAFDYDNGAGQFPPTRLDISVDTFDSHPMPIASASRGNNHTPSHHHYHSARPCYGQDQISMIGIQNNSFHQQQNYFQNLHQLEHQALYNRKEEAHWNPPQVKYNSDQQLPPPPQRIEGTTALTNFLSKFTDKVAAIWGPQFIGQSQCIPAYYEDHSSTTSTPVNNPWSTPSVNVNDPNLGANQRYYDLGAIQLQLEQQQQMIADSQQRAENFYMKQHQRDLLCQNDLQYHQFQMQIEPLVNHLKPSISKISDNLSNSALPPPKEGKYTIMHAMKQHFGSAPAEEDYHILRKVDVDSSPTEKERSLLSLNHRDDTSTFKRFVSSLKEEGFQDIQEHKLQKMNHATPEVNITAKESAQRAAELDLKNMQEMISGLDLECEEELEIVVACNKARAQNLANQVPQEDLLNSWKTHFSTIEAIERSQMYNQGSPSTTLSAHQINPNLPEYKLFDGNENDYNIFQRPGKTMFPVRYKLRQENDKGMQTEEWLLNQSSPLYNSKVVGSGVPNVSIFDWDSFGTGHEYQFSRFNLSGSRTSLDQRTQFDCDNSLEIHTSDWFTDGNNGLGSGSLADFDTGSGAIGGALTFSQSEYCCDSGIGIDNASQIGFYDDVYPDYEGDYECIGGGFEDGSQASGGGGRGSYATTNDNDVDYGQFQDLSYNATWSNSSASGKPNKSNRRRSKVKPCKYFLLDGSCRRGRDCKFSHDLTTCRYWAEGSCLKGDSCPYPHYYSDKHELVRRSGAKHIGKRYHLESENDFPTLGDTGESLSAATSLRDGFPSFSEFDISEPTISVNKDNLLMMLNPPSTSLYKFGSAEATAFDNTSYQQPPSQFEQDYTLPMPPGGSYFGGPTQLETNRHGQKARKTVDDSSQWIKPGNNQGSSTCHFPNQNNLNNNWIGSSIISVKEKRKKKKH